MSESGKSEKKNLTKEKPKVDSSKKKSEKGKRNNKEGIESSATLEEKKPKKDKRNEAQETQVLGIPAITISNSDVEMEVKDLADTTSEDEAVKEKTERKSIFKALSQLQEEESQKLMVRLVRNNPGQWIEIMHKTQEEYATSLSTEDLETVKSKYNFEPFKSNHREEEIRFNSDIEAAANFSIVKPIIENTEEVLRDKVLFMRILGVHENYLDEAKCLDNIIRKCEATYKNFKFREHKELDHVAEGGRINTTLKVGILTEERHMGIFLREYRKSIHECSQRGALVSNALSAEEGHKQTVRLMYHLNPIHVIDHKLIASWLPASATTRVETLGVSSVWSLFLERALQLEEIKQRSNDNGEKLKSLRWKLPKANSTGRFISGLGEALREVFQKIVVESLFEGYEETNLVLYYLILSVDHIGYMRMLIQILYEEHLRTVEADSVPPYSDWRYYGDLLIKHLDIKQTDYASDIRFFDSFTIQNSWCEKLKTMHFFKEFERDTAVYDVSYRCYEGGPGTWKKAEIDKLANNSFRNSFSNFGKRNVFSRLGDKPVTDDKDAYRRNRSRSYEREKYNRRDNDWNKSNRDRERSYNRSRSRSRQRGRSRERISDRRRYRSNSRDSYRDNRSYDRRSRVNIILPKEEKKKSQEERKRSSSVGSERHHKSRDCSNCGSKHHLSKHCDKPCKHCSGTGHSEYLCKKNKDREKNLSSMGH